MEPLICECTNSIKKRWEKDEYIPIASEAYGFCQIGFGLFSTTFGFLSLTYDCLRRRQRDEDYADIPVSAIILIGGIATAVDGLRRSGHLLALCAAYSIGPRDVTQMFPSLKQGG